MIAIPLALVVLLVMLASIVLRFEWAQKILDKVKAFIFWNFLIRYYQVSYINFQYASLAKLFEPLPVT